MKDIERIKEKVDKRKKQLEPLFTKDEENYNLWIGKATPFDKHPMSINITGTELPEKALRVQASINRSTLDIKVLPPKPKENPDAVENANQEERMYYHGFNMADERLTMTGNAALLSSVAWQITVLGRTAVRVLVFKCPITGEIIWDYLPLYPRFFSWDFDSMGLSWGAYETFRSPASIYDEYGIEVTEESEGKGVSVTDHWDREHNVRYLTKSGETLPIKIGGKEETEWEHKLEYVPIIFLPVARAPKAITTTGIDVAAWGESLFDHTKNPARNLDKLRSIVATQAFINAQPPLEAIQKGGSQERVEEQDLSRYPMAVINHSDNVELKVLDTKDIPPSILTMMSDIKQGIDRVTYTELSPDVTAHSGAALRILGQDKQDVLTPRVDVLNNLYTQICRMAKKQIISQKLKIPVQTVVNGEYRTFDVKPKMLENDFYINAKLIREDAYDEEARLQKAQMLMNLRLKSRESVMDKEMGEQDVPAEILKMDMEDVEAAVPEMKLKRLIAKYQELEMFEEADMMKEQLALLLIQKQQAIAGMGGQPQGASPPTSPPQGAT